MFQTTSPWYYRINGKLIKELKPAFAGDYVHIHRWDGLYKVYHSSVNFFVIMKNREFVELGWNKFRCKKGNKNKTAVNK